MTPERIEFEITLRPVPGNWRTPPLLRLRALLKAALRGYGFRATVCRPVQEAEALAEALALKAKENQKQSLGRGKKGCSILNNLKVKAWLKASKEAGVSMGSMSAYKFAKANATTEELAELKRDPSTP